MELGPFEKITFLPPDPLFLPEPGVGHHGGRGTTAAAMVHRVLLIDMCLVLDLCVGMVLTYRRSTLHIRS